MLLVGTVISLGSLAIGVLVSRPTRDVYPEELAVVENVLSAAEARPETLIVIQSINLPISEVSTSAKPAKPDQFDSILAAMSRVGVDQRLGLDAMSVATSFLERANYPVREIVPVVVSDLEEGIAYLTLRLIVDTDTDKALELDEALTERLVAAQVSIPSRLSLAVYEEM